ncbi:MAG: hypothetical protein LBQ78_00865 [Tannerellaceae bacterium]|jgi:hypothetical protein|nr:hypothetical protein [Tannerellaceae bacterium]
MKKKNIELDVDFIGGQEPLTKEEEKLISDFFQSKKAQTLKKEADKKRIAKPKKKELAQLKRAKA